VFLGLTEHWKALARHEITALAAAASCATLGSYALVAACRDVDLSVVTPFRDSFIVWALLLGYVIWAEVPAPSAALGLILIIAAGAFTIRSTRRS
jgi:drug/metabolite transporter (DMT)-like permease